jgi:serpin B
MVYMGATGATASEMSQTMHLGNKNKSELVDFYAKTTSKLGQAPSFKSANKVYLKGEIRASFKKVSENFNTDFEKMDFSSRQESAAEINRWVAKKTEEKVKNLINAETLRTSAPKRLS